MATRRTKNPVPPVALLGAGPGARDLLTVRGAELLAAADLVLADPDIPTALFDALPADVVTVGGEGAEDPAAMCLARARAGERVVRAYAGDPWLHPAGVAEARVLAKAKVPFEVVPGLSAAAAIPTYAGVPVGFPHTVASADGAADYAALAQAPGTLVLAARSGDIGKLAAALVEHGRPGDTPVAVTVRGTTIDQRTVVTTLDAAEAAAAVLGPEPAVVTVGNAVAQRRTLSWWETRPLFGWTVLVPRTREQAAVLSELLVGYGARPLEVPTIAVEPPRTRAPMERAIKGLVSGRYQWIAFTSTNAVKAVRERLEEYGLDARAFAGVKVAAIGHATADVLRAFGVRPDLVPVGEQQSSAGLLAEWPDYDDVLDPLDRVFLPRADIATDTLVAGLKDRGWAVDDVTAYRTVRAAPPPAPIREALKGGGVDAVVFTSSSTVRNLVGIAGKPHETTVLAVIGPATAETARELGLRVDVQAPEPSIPALVSSLAEFAAERADDRALGPAAKARPRRVSKR